MSEFIDWPGGKCPVGGQTRVEVLYRAGTRSGNLSAGVFAWDHDGDPGDIVGYRLAEDLPVPAPAFKPSNPKDLIGIRKAPMSTVSGPVIAEIGVAMLEGAAKYGRHNYRAVGVRASVYYDAAMRHLVSWWEGEDIDAESGMSHITKAITSLVVMRDSMIQGNWVDDRPPRSVDFYKQLNELAGTILDRHADKAPKHYTIADEVGGSA